MSRFVLFLLPSISLTPRVRMPGHCSKKNNGLIFLPQRQARQRQDSMTVKQVQRRRNRFNAIQADSKTTKHIPRHPSTFDRDSKRIPRRRRGWIPRRRRGFNEFEADITTTTQIPQQRYEFHDNDTDGHLSDQYGRRPVLLLGPLGLTITMFSFGMSTTFWPWSATGVTPRTSRLDHRDVFVRHVNYLLASRDFSMFSGRVQR